MLLQYDFYANARFNLAPLLIRVHFQLYVVRSL